MLVILISNNLRAKARSLSHRGCLLGFRHTLEAARTVHGAKGWYKVGTKVGLRQV